MNIVLLHYTYAPLVGGVESILKQHAALFAEQGHEVTVLCSEGVSDNPAVKVELIPTLRRDDPVVKSAQAELDAGAPGDNFADLKNRMATALTPHFQKADIVFLHNALTMHFNLALTVALWRLTEKFGGVHFVAWTHDIAACNPDYYFPHIDKEPWSLLAKRNPFAEYVAISELRKKQWVELTGMQAADCKVIPNGIDPIAYLDLDENVARFVKERGILKNDIVLLHPTRILKRKNIELGLRTVAEIKARGKSCCCLVTGAPDLFNPDVARYYESLLQLRKELALEKEFIFLHELFTVATRDLIGLYRVADMLFYPSKQEGFGLPMLEGALHGMPVFCADIEPMKSLVHHNVTFFDLGMPPAALAGAIIAHAENSPAIQARKSLMRDYAWDALYPACMEPLLQNQPHPL